MTNADFLALCPLLTAALIAGTVRIGNAGSYWSRGPDGTFSDLLGGYGDEPKIERRLATT